MINLKVARSTVRDQAVENIKEAIVTGFLRPGQRLIERDLCEMCGISRTSVREALRVLEGEKLIVNLPHKGPRVATPTIEEAEQIYEVRALLEAMLGRYAAMNVTDVEISNLDKSVDDFQDFVKTNDLRGMVAATEQFYLILGRVSDRPIAVDLLQTLKARISTLRATSMSSKGRGIHSAREMRAIVRAVAKRDAESAAAACVHHVQQAAKAAKIQLSRLEDIPPPEQPAPAPRSPARITKRRTVPA